jgi:hypothetical protein
VWPGSQRAPFRRRRTLTAKDLRGTISANNLVIDEELEFLTRIVVEGVGRIRKQNHDWTSCRCPCIAARDVIVNQLVHVLPNWFLVQPPPYQTVACLGDMLCFIVCFVSLPGPDVIFEWSDAWNRGFVDSLSHCQRTSIPFVGECGRLDGLVLWVIHGTEQPCFALLGAL